MPTAPARPAVTPAAPISRTCPSCGTHVSAADATCPQCGAAQPTGSPESTRLFLLLGGILLFVAGFALGRAGSGMRSQVAEASLAQVTATARRADAQYTRDSLSPKIKYDIFLRSAADSIPLGLKAWQLDNNGNLVLYSDKGAEWNRLTPEQQQAVMTLLGAGYTNYRLLVGMTSAAELRSRGQPVISLALVDGTVIATRVESGEVRLYK
jgi:hypothetical protein